MQILFRAAPILAVLLLAGCSMGPTNTTTVATGPMLTQPTPAPATITPASVPTTTALASGEVAMTDVSSFIDPTIVGRLSAKEKAEAASAQFNALTFGRPGAPRSWSGDAGAAGQVTVGPYVRVNNIDCRDFTHTVTVGGAPYAKKGTACKGTDGTWSVS